MISIVVCTNNCGDHLTPTLISLFNQEASKVEFEIIIVDNHYFPNHSIQKTYSQFIEHSFRNQLQCVTCGREGLSNARNAGVAVSNGEYICFIDDDAIASPIWVETMAQAFRKHPNAGVIGGQIILNIPSPRPRALLSGFEGLWSQFTVSNPAYFEVESWKDFPWGANWCVRREAILAIGGFNEAYGRGSFGREFWCGEELVAALQIQKLGYKIAIEPRAVVYHDVDRDRFTFAHIWHHVLSDKLVRYQMQKDGFLPVDNLDATKSSVLKFKLFIRPLVRLWGYRKFPILFLFQIGSQIILFFRKVRDAIKEPLRRDMNKKNLHD